MPTPTHIPLATKTLTSSASSVSFSSIVGSYRDLVLIVRPVFTSDGRNVQIAINGDNSGTSYSFVRMSGTGTSTNSITYTGQPYVYEYAYNNMMIVNFMDYSVTNKHKSVLIRSGSNSASFPSVDASVWRWGSTSAITSLTLNLNADSFLSGSTFDLFGIAG